MTLKPSKNARTIPYNAVSHYMRYVRAYKRKKKNKRTREAGRSSKSRQ